MSLSDVYLDHLPLFTYEVTEAAATHEFLSEEDRELHIAGYAVLSAVEKPFEIRFTWVASQSEKFQPKHSESAPALIQTIVVLTRQGAESTAEDEKPVIREILHKLNWQKKIQQTYSIIHLAAENGQQRASFTPLRVNLHQRIFERQGEQL